MNDEELITRLRGREAAALEILMDRYIGYISAVVWNILRQRMAKQDAEEVVSDVFVAAWNQSQDLQPGYLKAWLGQVARNKAKNKLRELGCDLPLEEDILVLPGQDTLEEDCIRADEALLVRQALEALGEPDREIFLRHYYFAQTTRQIGHSMHLKEATVKTKLHRGRMKLKQILMRWDVR